MSGTFAIRYEQWFFDRQRQDPELEQQLASEYRRIWEDGDVDDRYAVLSFIFWTRRSEGFHLVIQGLRDAELAQHAIATVTGLLVHDYDLGPELRNSIQEFALRFPEWEPLSTFALELLERKTQNTS